MKILAVTLDIPREATEDPISRRFRDCKRAAFPICLERSLTQVFHDEQLIMGIAKNNGFEFPEMSSIRAVWRIYLDLISALGAALGKDVARVIEFSAFKNMQSMRCSACPLYDLEIKRKNDKYNSPLLSISDLIQTTKSKLEFQ